MNTIISGSRRIVDPVTKELTDETFSYVEVVQAILQSGVNITKVICGDSEGVDAHAKEWAIRNEVPYEVFKADYFKYKKKAWHERNKEMIDHAEAIILVWDCFSSDGQDLRNLAFKKNIRIAYSPRSIRVVNIQQTIQQNHLRRLTFEGRPTTLAV